MKKLYLVVTLIVTLGLTSCLTTAVKNLEKVTEEATEIAEGKCFTVKQGTITYEDGRVVTFKDYGKTWASANATEHTVVKDGAYYVLDVENKTYYESYYSDSYSGCPYIFWENLYEYGDKWAGSNIKKSTETIAGKKCTIFTTEDQQTVGGWERVLFLSINGDGTTDFRAKSWSDNADESLLSLDGYTKSEY